MKKLIFLFTLIFAATSVFATTVTEEKLAQSLQQQVKDKATAQTEYLRWRRSQIDITVTAHIKPFSLGGSRHPLPESQTCKGLVLSKNGLVLLSKKCVDHFNKACSMPRISFEILGVQRGQTLHYRQMDLEKDIHYKTNGIFALYRMTPYVKTSAVPNSRSRVGFNSVETPKELGKRLTFIPIFTDDELILKDFEDIFGVRPDESLKELIASLASPEELELLVK